MFALKTLHYKIMKHGTQKVNYSFLYVNIEYLQDIEVCTQMSPLRSIRDSYYFLLLNSKLLNYLTNRLYVHIRSLDLDFRA